MDRRKPLVVAGTLLILHGQPAWAIDLFAEYSGTWIGPVEPDVQFDTAAAICDLQGGCTPAERRNLREEQVARQKRLDRLPRTIIIETGGTAYVGDMECEWDDRTRKHEPDGTWPETEWTETVVTCDGYKPITFGPAPGEHAASVDFGGLSATYIPEDEWQSRQKEKRQKRKQEQLKDWGQ